MISAMFRRVAPLALAVLLACQDYRFNPVGRCIVQPGQVRIPVADIHTADVLFVVDDSASMDPMQKTLADNFQAFVDQLAVIQADRVANGKVPLDFYIAVTTSSVFVSEYLGESCTNALTCSRTAAPAYSYACTTPGDLCGYLYTSYKDPTRACTTFDASGCGTSPPGCTCTAGAMPPSGGPYPSGSFVGSPTVLEFKGSLNWANAGSDSTIQALINQFKANVKVGSCGANQEMHLEASRRAIQRALAGQQILPSGQVWPHPGSKLVVVWMGNEDDCSTTQDPAKALVWDAGPPGNDSCVKDPTLRITPIDDYAAYFESLGRPFGAAFIYAGSISGPFAPGACTCEASSTVCGQACGAADGHALGGYRFHALANAFRGSTKGISVVEDSICKADFSPALTQIANLVKPPDSVNLPSAPAAGVVTQLRVVNSGDGKTVHVCDATAPASEWSFVDCSTGAAVAAGATSACISLKPGGACVPGQGQTLVAEYLGLVPGPSTSNPAGGCATSTDCANVLGGTAASWSCNGGSATVRGTCVCATQ
jgi:hypothetical protein